MSWFGKHNNFMFFLIFLYILFYLFVFFSIMQKKPELYEY